MGTKSVRLDDDVYEYIEAHKRDDEPFSDAVARLACRSSITELAGLLDSEAVDTVRERIDPHETERPQSSDPPL